MALNGLYCAYVPLVLKSMILDDYERSLCTLLQLHYIRVIESTKIRIKTDPMTHAISSRNVMYQWTLCFWQYTVCAELQITVCISWR